ncbi:hypothetical protein INT47_007665 [Mucor saturninus]|uniref:Arf-GAP domain-containing protein n=1 Tax=Mucor saturninus TaxID=64648 RepID=A0A8H7UY04_9FUNG|nr:hypothetical protein INT47_007665 [Mucor saturninus]
MSTRHARTADRASNEKYAKVLKTLLQKTPNKYCADCKKKDARWASWNLGVFVCIRCSGIHRSLGVHISKVKSVDLDTWVQDQVENMVRWGNERANKYWEANLKDKKPSESNMEMWIRAKYEQKRWAMKGPIPDPSTLGGDDEEVTQSPSILATSNTSSARQSPAPQRQQIEKPKPKQSEFANLDAFLGSPSSSPAISHQSKPVASQQLQGADFFFGTGSSPSPAAAAAAPVAEVQQNQNQKHNDFKSSILSLYNNMPAANSPSQQYNGGFQNQMTGLNLGGQPQLYQQQPQQYQQQQPQQYQQQLNNTNSMWGSFATASPVQPVQPVQPQGSQFFSSSNITPKKPERDAFADLLG